MDYNEDRSMKYRFQSIHHSLINTFPLRCELIAMNFVSAKRMVWGRVGGFDQKFAEFLRLCVGSRNIQEIRLQA
jgi:hypothetical protein